MVAAVTERYGAIDVLVNNVGGNVDFDRFVDSDPDTWERDIALNMTSTLNCTHAVLPGMIERSTGRIVNIGSTAGLIGDTMLAVYSAMKGAVHAFTKVLAKEVGMDGITVNAIAPYGTMPDDFEHDVSTGSRFHPDGVIARASATRGEEMATIGRRTNMQRQFALPGGDRCRRGLPGVRRRRLRHRSGLRRRGRGAARLIDIDGPPIFVTLCCHQYRLRHRGEPWRST